MNTAIEIVKQNPWKITLGTIITVCVTIGSFYFTDMRYMKRDEYNAFKEQIEQAVKDNRAAIEELSKQ
jgi:uncharacterized membrane protein (DUF106 family)